MKKRIWIICTVLVMIVLSGMGWWYWCYNAPASTMLPDFMLYTKDENISKSGYCYILHDGNKLSARIGNYLREDMEKGIITQEKTIREKTITLNEQQAQKILCLLNEVEKDRYSGVGVALGGNAVYMYFQGKRYQSMRVQIEEVYDTPTYLVNTVNIDLMKLNDYLISLVPFFDDPDWGFFYRAYAE